MKSLTYILFFSVLSPSAMAQEKLPAMVTTGNFDLDLLFIALGVLVVLLLWVAVVLLGTFKKLTNEILNPTPFVQEQQKLMEFDEWLAVEKTKPSIWNKILSLKPIEEEEGMKLEHEFDGISELDNPTPAWFNVIFYGTIAIGICYMLYYHVFEWGKLQDQEYVAEVQQAKEAKDAYLSHAANLIDENTVKESKDAAVIAAGAVVFKANCVACHGDKAQGIVGPNLTDEYWLHGGKINNVFKTIKYGVPDKGMISWEKSLSPKQISEVANYVKSLAGSNPPNPKAPQGDKEG